MSDVLSKCPVCQALLDEEDLFCGNCGTEAPPRPDQKRDDLAHSRLTTSIVQAAALDELRRLGGPVAMSVLRLRAARRPARRDGPFARAGRPFRDPARSGGIADAAVAWAGFLAAGRFEAAGDGGDDDGGVRSLLGFSGRDVHVLDGRYQPDAAGCLRELVSVVRRAPRSVPGTVGRRQRSTGAQ